MATFSILGIDHVVLRARDPEALEQFYVQVLGCVRERRVASIGLVQLRAGTALIDIVGAAASGDAVPQPAASNMDHLCLRIAPFDEANIRAHLIRHGVDPGPTERRYGADGYGPSIYLRDVEGNRLELKGSPEPGASPAV